MTSPIDDELNDLERLRNLPSTELKRHEDAYREGVAACVALLERLTALHEQTHASEQPGRPSLAWEFARGLIDTLQPGLDDSRTLTRSRQGARFISELRSTLLDDLTYGAQRALEVARTSPPEYTSRPEEW
jgi:hypothetical protein